MKFIDEVGKRYGRWTVVARATDQTGRVRFKCRCECGTEKVIDAGNLRRGFSLSCGCQMASKPKPQKVIIPRSKKSPIWFASDAEFRAMVERNTTRRGILKEFGLQNKGSNYKTVSARIIRDGIDASHLVVGAHQARISKPHKSLSQVMVVNSTYSRTHLRKRIIKEGLLPYVCVKCGLGSEWNGQSLSLILDHVNGVSDDHRKENLRFLCPNCNSQMPTFAGRNVNRQNKGGI